MLVPACGKSQLKTGRWASWPAQSRGVRQRSADIAGDCKRDTALCFLD